MSKRLLTMISLLAAIPLLMPVTAFSAEASKADTQTVQSSVGEVKMHLAKGQNNLPAQKGKEKSSCS